MKLGNNDKMAIEVGVLLTMRCNLGWQLKSWQME